MFLKGPRSGCLGLGYVAVASTMPSVPASGSTELVGLLGMALVPGQGRGAELRTPRAWESRFGVGAAWEGYWSADP